MEPPHPTAAGREAPPDDVRAAVVVAARHRLVYGPHPTALEVADALIAHALAWRTLLNPGP